MKELMNLSQFVISSKIKHDSEIQAIFEAIRQLMTPHEKPKGSIGFRQD